MEGSRQVSMTSVNSLSYSPPVSAQFSRPNSCEASLLSNTSADLTSFVEDVGQQQRTNIFTAGRPPWYKTDGQGIKPFVIGIAGGTASGKTTVANTIIQELGVPWVVLMSMDSFYNVLNDEQKKQAAESNYNFDHPNAIDYKLCVEVLKKLKSGKGVDLPIYDFATHSRIEGQMQKMYGANVIIFEGIMAFYTQEMRELMDMKIFVDTDSDIRLVRRLKRDIAERGRDVEGVINQYNKFVKPSFDEFVLPTMKHADIVIPRGADNVVAIDIVVKHVIRQLESRGFNFREQLLKAHVGKEMPDCLHVIPETEQIRGMHTILRNHSTSRDEFVFFTKRLGRLAVEYALGFLPQESCTVVTPTNHEFSGSTIDMSNIVGVSILRAGKTLEPALRDVIQNAQLGCVLIQTDPQTGEPCLHYLCLPEDVKDRRVVILDPTIATGAAALMAIRVILDHDVPEENIIFISILAAPAGVHSIAYAFPKVNIITTAIDTLVNQNFHIIPGIGNFGDRYFGTGME